METRKSGRRAANVSSTAPPAGRATRRTRQTTPAAADKTSATSPVTRRNQPVKPTAAVQPPPRRGAPAREQAGSVASLPPTQVGNDSDEDVNPSSGTHGTYAAGEPEDGLKDSSGPEDDELQEDEIEDEETRRQIMAHSLPSLFSRSQELIARLKKPDHGNPVFRGLWKRERQVFVDVRETFQELDDDPSSLINWPELVAILNEVPGVATRNAAIILACANLATVLNSLEAIMSGGSIDLLVFLDNIDTTFPAFFTVTDTSSADADMTLAIRTSLCVEQLAVQKSKADFNAIIASIFCEQTDDDDDDYPRIFASGPFKPLGGPDQKAEGELCAERIKEIYVTTRGKKTLNNSISQLRQKFPLEDLLVELREWILHANAAHVAQSQKAVVTQPTPEGEEFHDAEEDPAEVDESVSESQAIQRPGNDEQPLFVGIESLEALESGPAPQSSQQQAPPQGTPLDYLEHTNRDILTTRRFPQSSQAATNGQNGGTKRPRVAESAEEGEEDEFETDERPVGKDKRATIKAEVASKHRRANTTEAPASAATQPVAEGESPSKRRRTAAPTSVSAQSPTSVSARPPSPWTRRLMSPLGDIPPSSHSAREAMNRKKAELAVLARRDNPAPSRQRHPWSDADCDALVQLVALRQAGWGMMELQDGECFERPRNQQAYRDKARNMKVDFLMTDAVLPTCFDLVHLGTKEVAKLKGVGKNPSRRESEVNEDGTVYNTEYYIPGEAE